MKLKFSVLSYSPERIHNAADKDKTHDKSHSVLLKGAIATTKAYSSPALGVGGIEVAKNNFRLTLNLV